MAIRGQRIKNIPAGATARIVRTYTGLPVGVSIVKAYFTVEKRLGSTETIFQKTITTSLSAAGQITDADTADGALSLFFNLSSAETLLLTPHKTYFYDIQAIANDGAVYPLEVESQLIPLQRSTDEVT